MKLQRKQRREAEERRSKEVAAAVAKAKASKTSTSGDSVLGDDAELFEFYAGGADGGASTFVSSE